MSAPVDVRHVVDGPVGAPVVVLAHAIGSSMSMWEPQARALAADFRIVRYDSRGHGSSPVPAGPYEIADFGADLLRLLDRLDVERASLCGLSLGGMTVLWAAAHAPDRIERLVAMCVTARPSSPQAWFDRADAVRRGGTAAVADLVAERWGYFGRHHSLEALVRASLMTTPADGYAASCEAIARMDLWPDLPSITAPTLILAGSEDPAAPVEEAERIRASIPDARAAVIDGAAHLATMDRPVEVTDAIRTHLAPLLAKERP